MNLTELAARATKLREAATTAEGLHTKVTSMIRSDDPVAAVRADTTLGPAIAQWPSSIKDAIGDLVMVHSPKTPTPIPFDSAHSAMMTHAQDANRSGAWAVAHAERMAEKIGQGEFIKAIMPALPNPRAVSKAAFTNEADDIVRTHTLEDLDGLRVRLDEMRSSAALAADALEAAPVIY